ncbi:permease [Saccharicrinis sp. FJH54]|uniref:permease n=1 Tax=Saccharicrinis sp. FJH54 TaxID=3344665 RepID=UPI0035D4A163
MIAWILKYFEALLDISVEMAPYLLLGFLLAGAMKVFLPQNFVNKYMGKGNRWSVMNAALIGVPLPLCSCGVIPTGISFYKNGAGKGASVSFLVSTPQTGFDSIMITYSLLGLPFALLRPVIAFVTGIFSGLVTDAVTHRDAVEPMQKVAAHSYETGRKWGRLFHYALEEFLMDIAKWLIIGLMLAALITVVVPDEFFMNYLNSSLISMLVILAVSMPLYICATASVPIAAALMLKGLSPGAALVLLMAGPATNAATMTVIKQTMGTKTLIVYLATIISGALLSGFIIDTFLPASWFVLPAEMLHGHHHILPEWLHVAAALVLLLSVLRGYLKPVYLNLKRKLNTKIMEKQVFKVEGMGCKMCSDKIETGLRSFENVSFASADHVSGDVVVEGDKLESDLIKSKISDLGYKVV